MRSPAELDALIDDLTVDAYGDEEQEGAFLVGAEEALVRCERAWIAGGEVEVVAIDSGPDVRTGLRAKVRSGGVTYRVSLAELTFPESSELDVVVAAYRRWLGWR